MSGFEIVLLSYVLNSLWQAPLVFVASVDCGARAASGGPGGGASRVGGRVGAGELCCRRFRFFRGSELHFAWPWHAQGGSIGDAQVSVQMGAGAGFAALRLSPAVMTALAIAYAADDGLLHCAVCVAMRAAFGV